MFINNVPINPFLGPSLRYSIHLRDEFDKFLTTTPFTIHDFSPNKRCYYRNHNICWEYNTAFLFKRANYKQIVVFGASILTMLLVVWLLLSKIKSNKLEEEKKKLALHVLSHEFRTPVTNMILHAENLQSEIPKLPEKVQDSIMMIISDIYRLQRLTEVSRNYLHLEHIKTLIKQNPQVIESINEYVESCLDHIRSNIDIKFINQTPDAKFFMDTYWPAIAIKNLVNNAILHGKQPITVLIKVTDDLFTLEVSDQGECQFEDIKALTSEFVKGSKSIGTGLGLNIVKKVSEELGGGLAYSKNPTTFTLTIPKAKQRRQTT